MFFLDVVIFIKTRIVDTVHKTWRRIATKKVGSESGSCAHKKLLIMRSRCEPNSEDDAGSREDEDDGPDDGHEKQLDRESHENASTTVNNESEDNAEEDYVCEEEVSVAREHRDERDKTGENDAHLEHAMTADVMPQSHAQDPIMPIGCYEIEHQVLRSGCVRRLLMHTVDITNDSKRFEVVQSLQPPAVDGQDNYEHLYFSDIQHAINSVRKHNNTTTAVGTSAKSKRRFSQFSREDNTKIAGAVDKVDRAHDKVTRIATSR